ncbi:T6SS effector phospholipase Tle3 domain-containing protein, partial [Ralstonia pseudosolanacearum]
MTDSTSNSPRILVGSVTGLTLFDHRELICVKRSPLPGIVIFVHGVNSDGEWFTAAEEGLCKGGNRRLGRL